MPWHSLRSRLKAFAEDTSGAIMVESIVTLPILIMVLAATFEFFEIHRYKSAREKATYTVADMISRELGVVTETYMDNTKVLFDEVANDDGDNQIRVSIIRFLEAPDMYEVSWSETRGTGAMVPLVDNDVANAHQRLPILRDGEELILVESLSTYQPIFDVGLSDGFAVETRVFTSLRFAPQICFNECSGA